MVFSAVGESTNIINIDFCVFNIAEYIFHGLMSKIRRTFESHWQYIVLIFAEWCDDGHQVFGFVTLLSSRRSLTQRMRPSFFGVMNVGDLHSLAPCGDRTPLQTRWSSSFSKGSRCILAIV
jgi:hypothetical protein